MTNLPGVQQQYVRAREILGEVLCLFAPLSPTKRSYCTVLSVSTINFLLKAEEEQDALVERYRNLLKALSFPIQIVVRNQRLDLRPYLDRVRAQIPTTQETGQWAQLAEGLGTLLEQIGSQRTLTQRQCYVIVPAPPLVPASRSLRRKRRHRHHEELVGRALQDLSIRVEMVQTQLASLGLRSQRLMGEELARVYHRFLSPEQALQHPLRRANLAAVGYLPEIAWYTALATRERLQPSPTVSPLENQPSQPNRSSRRRRQQEGSSGNEPIRALPPADFLRLTDLFAPASIEEQRDALRVDDEYVRTLAITAFPREVSTGSWLAPLLLLDDVFDLCLHLHPQNQAAMMRMLKRRRVGHASARALNRQQGRLDDPTTDVAQHDVSRLMHGLASGDERLFEVSFLLMVRAPTKAALDERSDRLLALLQTIFLDAVAHPTTFEHAQAFRSFLPEAHDELRRTITLDASSLATTFPFVSNALLMPKGTFLGLTGTGEPVLLDPWDASLENPHTFIGGVTGGGKSYLGKLWIERGLLLNGRDGEHLSVIDPDGEYRREAEALGGATVHLAAGSEHHLNPFDLLPPGSPFATYLANVQRLDRLAEKIQDLHSLLDLMLADHGSVLSTREKALLDRALYETYRRVGITSDPPTHHLQPPLLRGLSEVLTSGVCGPDDSDLALRLSRYVDGSLAGLFANQTNVPLDSPLLVWNIRDMRGDLRPIGIFLIADCTWTQALAQNHVRRALYIDEAASLIEHEEGGRFLANLSRRARKYFLRLVFMTQSPAAFTTDTWGSVIAANAAIKILKKQDQTSLRAVAQAFDLTHSEAQRLLTFGVQEALLCVGDRRVLLTVRASAEEHTIITTNPVELAEQARIAAEMEQSGTWEVHR